MEKFYYRYLWNTHKSIQRLMCDWLGHKWESYDVTKYVFTRRGYRWRDFTNYSCSRCGKHVWYRSDTLNLWQRLSLYRTRFYWWYQTKMEGKKKLESQDDLPF